jgi:PAS domain S-box-containing protein
VSRVYIFEDYNNGLLCKNTFEWCNQGVTSQRSQLQDIHYSDIPSWKQLLSEKGHIDTSNIANLPGDLIPILDQQNIKALLIFPLQAGAETIGFIGFDECSYHRQWLDLEVALLATAAHLVENAYLQNQAMSQIHGSLNIQKFLYRVAASLNHPDVLEVTMDSVAREFIETWDLSMVTIYNLENPGSGDFELFSRAFKTGNGHVFPQKIAISSFDQIPVFPKIRNLEMALTETGSSRIDLTSFGFPDNKGVIMAIQTQNKINGLVVLNWNSMETLSPVPEHVMETLSGLIARAFDHRLTYLQNKEQHKQILDINKQLVDKEQFLNNIISSAPIGVLLVKDRVIQYVNDHVVTSSLYSMGELIGKPISEMYADGQEQLDDIYRFYTEIKQQGISTIDTIMKRKDGSILYYNIIGTPGPRYEEDGYILLVGQDLTQIKHTEKSLRESEERNKQIIEATIDGIFIMSEPGKLEYVNNSGCELTGYTRDELTVLSLEQLFPEKNNMKDFLSIFNQVRRGKEYKGDSQMRHRNGSTLYVEIFGTTINLEGREHYYFNIHDISRRKQNEAALKLSENKFRTLSENLPDCILRINRSGLVTYSNSLFLNLFNLQPKELSGRPVFNIEELPREVSDRFKNALIEVFNLKRIAHLEVDLRRDDDTLTFDWSLSPEMDLAGNCISVLGIGRDISHRKKVEQELVLAKDHAEAADRLKSAFLANMSHEIRTPLNAIVGFSNLLSQTDPENGDRDEYVSLINKSADSLMALINDIIDIAKIESGHLVIAKKPVDVNQVIGPIYTIYQQRVDQTFQGKVKFILNQPSRNDHVFVEADPSRLLQVLNNLLDNAIKFVHEGVIEFGYASEGTRIRFFVKDTGIGIAPENQLMVFNAFRQEEETTSKKYGGTGLGLAISKKLIESMGGEIHLISEKGKGSEFYFYLEGIQLNSETTPVYTRKEVALPAPEPIETTASQAVMTKIPNWSNRMILLVDENSSVHLNLKKQLEKTRITVLSARSASSARHLLLKRKDIDLVIMDNHLPDIEAAELTRQLRGAGIQIPLIIQTNGESDQERSILMQAGFDSYVRKPVAASDLIPKIHHFLSSMEVNPA